MQEGQDIRPVSESGKNFPEPLLLEPFFSEARYRLILEGLSRVVNNAAFIKFAQERGVVLDLPSYSDTDKFERLARIMSLIAEFVTTKKFVQSRDEIHYPR